MFGAAFAAKGGKLKAPGIEERVNDEEDDAECTAKIAN